MLSGSILKGFFYEGPFVHLFYKYSLNTFNMQETILNARGLKINKTESLRPSNLSLDQSALYKALKLGKLEKM